MATAKSKTDLITDADSFLPDNITEDISPGDVRDRVKDLASSMLNIIDGGFVVTQLTGYASALTPTDDKHFANKKYVDDAIAGLSTGLTYLGTWDASTNTPTIVSSTGNNGEYYIVNVDGSTNIDGITDWKIGDWIIFNGGTWQKIDQSIDFADGYPLYDARYAKLDGTNSPFTGDVTFNEDIIINTQGSFNRQFRFQNGATILVSANIFGTEYSHGARLSTYNIFSTSEIRLRRQNSSGGWINTPFVFDLTNSQFTASGAAGTKNGIITDGSIKVANNSQTAAAAGAGSIRYNSGIEYSDGAAWNGVLTSASLTPYAKLDGTNTPFTGDITIQKASPFFELFDGTSKFKAASVGSQVFLNAVGDYIELGVQSGAQNKVLINGSGAAVGITNRLGSGSFIVRDGSSTHSFTYSGTSRIMTFTSSVPNTQNRIVLDGSIKISNNSQTAVAAGAGSIKYDSGIQISDASNWEKAITSPLSNTKVTAGAPYTNDGYIEVRINGTLVKLMTTA